MNDRSALQHQLAQKIGFSLLLGTLVWIVLLARGAAVLRGQGGNVEYMVTFGPFALNHISKTGTRDGFTATFSFEYGLLWYLLAWILSGLLLGVLVARVRHGRSSKQAGGEETDA